MDSSTSTAVPQLRFLNSEAATWQQLPSKPGADRTSYYITKDSGSASSALKLSSGDFEDGNHGNPDLIVGIHIQSSGTIFIESLHHAQDVRLSHETKPNSRQIKRPLPCSKPPKERMLVLLDSDATIFVNSETLLFELGTPPPSLSADVEGDIVMEEEDEPHVLVQQSYPQELKWGESDMVHSTPAIPETITGEPRVHETPSVKSRFMNPDSATVTLPSGMPREDTFGGVIDGDVELTPKGNQEQEIKGRRLFGTDKKISGAETPRKENRNFDSTAGSAEERENKERGNRSSAEVMRRQFSESAMITSFGSEMCEVVREATSPATKDEEREEEGKLPDGENTHKNHIKRHGIPEGFLYEEHKKDMTPKQVYGKNKRRPAPAPKEKQAVGKRRASNGTATSASNSEGESIKATQVNRTSPKHTREKNATDESEGEEIEALPRIRNGTIATGEDDTAMETADEEDEIVPPPRTQRGRRTVQSLPSTATTTQDNVVEVKRSARGEKTVSTKKVEKAAEAQDEESDVEEKETGIPSTVKPTRGTRDRGETKKLPDVEENVPSTALEGTPGEAPKVPPGTKPTRKRRRHGDIDEDENPSLPTTREGTAESTIHLTEQPKPKRAKMTPVKKAPAAKRWKKKDVAPPLPESSGKLDDTQYTIQVTQTQTLDQAEAKTPKTAKKKTALPARKSSAKKKGVDSQPLESGGGEEDEEAEQTDQGKTRTKDRYEGDAPKIVFSNSGLDGRKDIEKFLRANGGKKMQNVSAPGVNFLIVGPGELKRTPKLTVGVAMGKYVVEDQWLIDSKEVGYFLDPDKYIPYDPTHEKAWSFSLTAAISRGRKGLNCILKDHNVYITSSLLSQLKASKQEDPLIEMLKAAGAGTITKKSPKGKREDDEHAEQTLILGAEKGDSDVAALEKAGWTVYGTGIVAISVLRGKLDVGEEFRIAVPDVETSQKVARGRKGKQLVLD